MCELLQVPLVKLLKSSTMTMTFLMMIMTRMLKTTKEDGRIHEVIGGAGGMTGTTGMIMTMVLVGVVGVRMCKIVA